MVRVNWRLLRKKIAYLILVLFMSIILVFPGSMVLAEDECILTPKDSWRNKFPMGFVTGTPPSSDFFDKCPKVLIFGYEYEVCAVKTLMQILKNVVLVKFIVNSLQNL